MEPTRPWLLESRALLYGTSHEGAPDVGALSFFAGQNSRFRPFFSVFPHGALFSFSTHGHMGSTAKVKAAPLPSFTMNRHFS
jgi:hypothetical protein